MSGQPRVLLLTSSLERGGAESHVITLAQELQKLGCSVAVVSSGGRLVSELEAEGINHYRTALDSRSPWNIVKSRRKLKKIIKKQKTTVIHAHSRIAAFAVSPIAKKLHIPFVTTVHAKFATPWYLRRLSRWGDISVAVSEDLRDYLCKSYKISPENTRVVSNGVDVSRFYPRKNDVKKRKIVFASRLDGDCSRTAFLLLSLSERICENYPDTEFLICGGGDKYSELASKAEGKPFFRMLGDIGKMEKILTDAWMFVGVSRAAMEAMACGIPTILSGDEGYIGLIENEEQLKRAALCNFCCRGENPTTEERLFYDICKGLSLSKTEREGVGKMLFEYVEQNHSAAVMARENLNAYGEVYKRSKKKEGGVLLCGYYGFGNMGDNALLRASVDIARKRYKDKPVCALTKSPGKDESEFNVRCVRRSSPFAVRREISRASVLAFGGGTLLQENTSLRSLWYYSSIIKYAWKKGVPVELWGNGLGAPRSDLGRKLMKSALSKCRYLGIRDGASLSECVEILGEGKKSNICREDDLAKGKAPACSERVDYILKSVGITEKTAPKGYAVVAVKGSENKGYKEIFDKWLLSLVLDGIKLLVVPMFPKEDREESLGLCRRLGGVLLEGIGEGDMVGIIKRGQVVCGMRFHSLVFAASVETPFVGFGGDTKIESFCRENGGLYFTDLY
ncbi:MAG: glycosyltransferase [Ruminococcaceae bacterium]|nr:glycosyltransferase [Oscillospiraceae bacterium]